MQPMVREAAFSLDEKYTRQRGVALMSGIHALVRALQTRAILDRARGLRSGGLISGYRGSPLGRPDKELWSQQQRLQEFNTPPSPVVVFDPDQRAA